jgi:hypothetical protein
MMKHYITETEVLTFAGFGAVFYFLYNYNLFPFIIGIFVGGVLTILYMANFALFKIWPTFRHVFLRNVITPEMKPKTIFDILEEIKRGVGPEASKDPEGSEEPKSEKSDPEFHNPTLKTEFWRKRRPDYL